MSPGTAQFALSYQLCPIIFCGGIAQNIPGGVMPITQITESDSFPSGLLSSGGPPSLSDYFANFIPLPGATLGENAIGEYPFANQAVAGNAIIAQPLVVSCLMICPARDPSGYAAGTAIMAALVSAMAQHDSLGGTYTYVTPKFFYTDLARIRMVDVSSAESKQAQNAYQIDFRKPLLTLQAAQAAQNTLMSKISSGTKVAATTTPAPATTPGSTPTPPPTPDPVTGLMPGEQVIPPGYSGSSPSVGNPSSLVGTSLPSGASTAGTNTAPDAGMMPGEQIIPAGPTKVSPITSPMSTFAFPMS